MLTGKNPPQVRRTLARLLDLHAGFVIIQITFVFNTLGFVRMPHPHMQKVVTLFRDPRKRALSAWNHMKHTHHLGTKDAESRFPNSRKLLETETQTARDFGRHKHVKSCQTKMLVGGQVR